MNKQDKTDKTLISSVDPEMERKLIEAAKRGDRLALESLVERYQPVIFNIALRMVYIQEDAEDITQEVLIKVITQLSSFNFKSSLGTWIYRITANHMINMQQRPAEKFLRSFQEYGENIDKAPDKPVEDYLKTSSEYDLILEEVRLECFTGMLLCLNRRRRLAFILGEVLGTSPKVGAEIMELRVDNFRQLLSRARREVYDFMKSRCGLVDNDKHCHCHLKAQNMIDTKLLIPHKYRFAVRDGKPMYTMNPARYTRIQDYISEKCSELFADAPIRGSESFVDFLRELTQTSEFKHLFHLSDPPD